MATTAGHRQPADPPTLVVLADIAPLGGLRPLLGPAPQIVVELADGGVVLRGASAESAAVRLTRAGRPPRIEARPRASRWSVVRSRRAHGRATVAEVRADPSLLTEVQVGGWFNAGWRARNVRRLLLGLPVPSLALPVGLAADLAFWRGVRAEATATEWRRWTRSSYVVLCYHRLAGAAAAGEERMDVAPKALRRQLRLLRLCRWRPLTTAQLEEFHTDPEAVLPRRRYLVTADDGFAEAVAELAQHARHRPQMFAVTAHVGGRAGWLNQVPLADREALRDFERRGGTVGSHAREHVRLNEEDPAARRELIAGARQDLRHLVLSPEPSIAYPHGAHDLAVRDEVRAAATDSASPLRQGRNGAGTDPWCLRRVEPKIWDTRASFVFKLLTGESPPPLWERRLERTWREAR